MILNFHLKPVLMCLYAVVLDLLNFQLRDSVFVNIAFHFPVTSHWSDRSLSFSTFLAALFILITQTDLVYHQQFGLVYSRFKCLGDKLSSLVHVKMHGIRFENDLLNRHFMSRCWWSQVDINIFPIHRLQGSSWFACCWKS